MTQFRGIILLKYLVSTALGAVTLAIASTPILADVLAKVEATGVIRAGTRADAAPFAFLNQNGDPIGFSVDLLEEIRAAASATLGKDLRLELTTVTTTNRISLVETGELDIVCEITTPTWEREGHVDFSIPFFRDGTRVLAFRKTLNDVSEVHDMTVGVVDGTTTAAILTDSLPGVDIQTFPSMDAAFAALQRDEIDGVANVGIILLGLAQQLAPEQSVVLLPRTAPLGDETMACILPENDSGWRDFVNATLIGLTDGLSDYRGRYMEIYEKWFGRDGVLTYPIDRTTRDYILRGDIWAQ